MRKELAATKLRAEPCLPDGRGAVDVGSGDLWPRAFCAFRGCQWNDPMGDDHSLQSHLLEVHASDLQPVAFSMLRGDAPDAIFSAYTAAVAEVCRLQAPVAGSSIDRTALCAFTECLQGDGVEALVCFSCACIHTRVACLSGEQNGIEWRRPLTSFEGKTSFLGRPVSVVEELLGLDVFLERYDLIASGSDARISDSESFHCWTMELVGGSGRKLLCCPEAQTFTFFLILQDRRCTAVVPHGDDGILCEECEVPLCSECGTFLAKGKLPPLCLANDMWTGFSPACLFEKGVTVMELICASPCVTTLLCLSMEARFENNRKHDQREAAPLTSRVQMARHRFGARGNALTFPLPMESVFEILKNHENELDDVSPGVRLPRTSEELVPIARVLLKTNKDGVCSAGDVKHLIHQAVVRRKAWLVFVFVFFCSFFFLFTLICLL